MTFTDEPPVVDAVEVVGVPCGEPGCDYVGTSASQAGVHRWSAHGIRGKSKKKGGPRGRPVGSTNKDRAPSSVNINLGAAKASTKDKELAAVEERAKQLMQTAAALLLLTGNGADAGDLAQGSDQWARSVRELAVYEDWLRKLASGGEIAGRTMAWVNLVLITLSISVPILVRHDVLPDNLAQMAQSMFGVAEGLMQQEADVDGAQAA